MTSPLTADLSLADIEAHIRHWTEQYRARPDGELKDRADLARWSWISMWLERQTTNRCMTPPCR